MFDAVSDVSMELKDGCVTAIVGGKRERQEHLCQSAVLCRTAGQWAGVSGQFGGDRLRQKGSPHGKRQGPAGDAERFGVFRSSPERGGHPGGGPLRLLFHMGIEERKRRCLELLDMARLERDMLRRRPDELSGGQQKRLCIARALAAQPQHIIFDESFSGLDVTLKKQVLDFLKELQTKLQISFLVITHDLDTAMYMAGTIHVMRRGKIIETLENPRSFSDFQEPYSQELVKAVRSKRMALQ